MNSYNTPLDLVLLVDDDETTNYLNERLLKEMNIAKQILVLKNGKEALDYMSRAEEAEENRPDLIFLDIKMPVMDGFSFLEEYHNRGLDAGDHVIIMMLTSSASFYDLERLKQYSRVKGHFSKALIRHDVQEIMNDYFKRKKTNK